MKATLLNCPACGAPIDSDVRGREFVYCSYCGSKIHLEPEKSEDDAEKTADKNSDDVSSEEFEKVLNVLIDGANKVKKGVFEKVITVIILIAFIIVLVIVLRSFFANDLFRILSGR